MPIPVTCGHCHKSFKASDSAAGRKTKCPSCGSTIEIPAATGATEAPPHAPATHPADALAAALAQPAAAATPPAPEPTAETVKPEPVRPEPVQAQPVAAQAPTAAAAAAPAAPAAPAADAAAPGDEDEMITVPPIGVQTPSGLMLGRRAQARHTHRAQRKMAGWARIIGAGLGGLCLVVGITGMIYLAVATRKLPTALGVFLLMVILAAAMFSAGLLARHLLLAMTDMDERLCRQEDLLDEINERLG